mmetsp:Transcript_40741/g.105736  ORF Transcript_40741/g.105736 Transcript_40741/m.105736 type:complete len:202 (-) Transcript_40741:39-644(-)
MDMYRRAIAKRRQAAADASRLGESFTKEKPPLTVGGVTVAGLVGVSPFFSSSCEAGRHKAGGSKGGGRSSGMLFDAWKLRGIPPTGKSKGGEGACSPGTFNALSVLARFTPLFRLRAPSCSPFRFPKAAVLAASPSPCISSCVRTGDLAHRSGDFEEEANSISHLIVSAFNNSMLSTNCVSLTTGTSLIGLDTAVHEKEKK